MQTRRDFIRQSALVTIASSCAGIAAGSSSAPAVKSAHRARRASLPIKSAARRDETILRYGGFGDCFHMSWAANGRQYVSVCDGLGWSKESKGDWVFNSRLWSIEGDPTNASFHDVPTYPSLTAAPFGERQAPRYYNFGTLAIDSYIYQFLSTFNHRVDGAGLRFNGAKLIYSPDDGLTWRNQNGSSPVTWEDWEHRSRKTMTFFEESQGAFSLFSVLQMGKGYDQNRDGYVYVYSPNGYVEGTMNELMMFRVHKDWLLDRSHYEYFAGYQPDGSPKWSVEIEDRKPTHVFPAGWVNTALHPYAWVPSVVYNAPLDVYMMTSWGMGTNDKGGWFAKPSYLGFWTARHPWGPWTQIHEETAWLPDGDQNARAFQPQIAPKWIAPDGKSFWLVWTDYQRKPTSDDAEFAVLEKKAQPTRNELRRMMEIMPKIAPYYSFNAQRVDLGKS